MEPYDGLLKNIRRFVPFTQEEEAQLREITQVVPVKRRQFVDQPGYVCDCRNYVVRGAFRSYFVDQDGKEHTVQIAVEDWFISDFYSYITRTPATLFVEALENATILQMRYEDVEPLCAKLHSLSEYFRTTTERAFAFSRNRSLSNLSKTAEERYLEMLDRYPNIVGRVPQKVIASYLGITPEFLSKIRKQLAMRS